MMIRLLTTEDIEDVMQLWLDTNIMAHGFIEEAYWRQNFALVQDMLPQATVYVYEGAGKVRAFIGVMAGYLAGLFVAGDYQSKGIGKALLDHVKMQHQVLSLSVYQNNERAVGFYLREGFVKTVAQRDEQTGEMEWVMTWKR